MKSILELMVVRDNQTSYAKEWNDDYKLDLIGREYCRDRQLDCSKQEFDTIDDMATS